MLTPTSQIRPRPTCVAIGAIRIVLDIMKRLVMTLTERNICYVSHVFELYCNTN